ncbi:maleylpyruvate isomerase family mycothiol-dependent enzyme [Naumannella sp. ID2617S]|nr:maleylpyruvate isomerase family mycothiol-dependent enzyme [Naumannella sp. ID2617S]
MATLIDWEELGDGIGRAGTVLRANATSAGLDAPVPTCPDWTVRDLVVHQGMVHRWATDVLLGRGMSDGSAHTEAGRQATDLLDWFDDGWAELLSTLGGAPENLDVPFFLRTGDSPRVGWARRQCHETSIHAVDALAARLGRTPTAAETWLTPRLAADGIDELLTGFVPRRRTGLTNPEPLTVDVTATDTGRSWSLDIGPEGTRTRTGPSPEGGVRLSAPAVELYLALWNRGDQVDDPQQFLPRWHDVVRVDW